MERIKQALEKARAERDRSTGRSGRKPGLAVAVPAREPADEAALPDIDYTQTHVARVPQEELRENRIIAGIPQVPESAGYKMLRTRVAQRMRANNWSTLGVTSPGAGEGKTLTAVNLAVALAGEEGHTVLLVDADLRRPSVHDCFGRLDTVGLIDHLTDSVPLSEILFNPGIPRLVVLPGGSPVADSSDILASPRMKALVKDTKERYPSRLIVFDLPPVLASDDVIAFSPLIDALLMVVEDGKTRGKDVTRTMDLLEGRPIIGTVLNKSDDRASNYYYY